MKTTKNVWVIFKKDNSISYENKIISFLPSRKGVSHIKEYIEQVWFDHFLSFEERIRFSNQRRKLSYKATISGYNNVPCSGRIVCGAHGMEIFAIHCYAYELKGSFIEFYYKLVSKYDLNNPGEIEWKYFSVKIDSN